MGEGPFHQPHRQIGKMAGGVVFEVEGFLVLRQLGDKRRKPGVGIEFQHLDVNDIVDGVEKLKRRVVIEEHREEFEKSTKR